MVSLLAAGHLGNLGTNFQASTNKTTPSKVKDVINGPCLAVCLCSFTVSILLYGNFVQTFGSEYINCHRNWDDMLDTIQALWGRQPPLNKPPSDLEPEGK
jgi:hypothetical protein